MGNPLGGWGSVVRTPVFDGEESVAIRERWLCQARRADARYASVVRSPVVRIARYAERDPVLGVVQIKARCAGVISCRRGAAMRAAAERHWPARPTRPCTRPLRARDRGVFERQIQSIVIAISVGGG